MLISARFPFEDSKRSGGSAMPREIKPGQQVDEEPQSMAGLLWTPPHLSRAALVRRAACRAAGALPAAAPIQAKTSLSSSPLTVPPSGGRSRGQPRAAGHGKAGSPHAALHLTLHYTPVERAEIWERAQEAGIPVSYFSGLICLDRSGQMPCHERSA